MADEPVKDTSELLVEIRAERFPAGAQQRRSRRLRDRLIKELKSRGWDPQRAAIGSTPRRVVVVLRELGVSDYESAGAQLAEALQETLGSLFEKRSYSQAEQPLARPLSGICLLLDGELVPFSFDDIEATAHTIGHHALSPQRLRVDDAEDYLNKLMKLDIEVRPDERLRQFRGAADALAQTCGGHVRSDEGLLARWAAECESSGAVVGAFDTQFLSLPDEVVVAVLRGRQRALAVERRGQLLPHFVAPMDRPDDPEGRVREGNESAVGAHLLDARFMYDRDREKPLAQRAREMASTPFDGRRSTCGERAQSLEASCLLICRELRLRSLEDSVSEAARLLDSDRDCELRREFPQLGGRVAGLLAREEGYPSTVWQSLYDCRSGEAQSAETPRGKVAYVLALADRLERVVADSTGKESARSRKSSLARLDEIVRLAAQGDLDLDVQLLAAGGARAQGIEQLGDRWQHLRKVISEGLESALETRGFERREVKAVLQADGSSRLPSLLQRLEALRTLRTDERLVDVCTMAKRLREILIESRELTINESALIEPPERALHQEIERSEGLLAAAMVDSRFDDWLEGLHLLSQVVELFLNEVLVRDEVERLRQNRLALLQRVYRVYSNHVRFAVLAG